RAEKLKGSAELEQGKMRAHFDRATMIQKENFDLTLRDLRDTNKREQEKMFTHFATTAQENDVKHQQQMSEVGLKYEKQIAEIQAKHLKELKEHEALVSRQKKELESKGQLEVQTVVGQYENRLSKIEDGHKREIDQLHRKHQETLANLTKNRQA
ncbi:MAG: hypothetical protein V4692_09640, partial [Bdellovibrionota bacterium]